MKATKDGKPIKLHRAWSVQATVLSAVLAVQEALPLWENIVPENAFIIASAAVATAAIVLRGIDQGTALTD